MFFLSSKILTKKLQTKFTDFARFFYMSHTNNLEKLKSRGLILNYFPDDKSPDLIKLFQNAPNINPPLSVYCGFDPTSDSLHLGNLISLMLLLHAQKAGFQPIAVIGGATAEIGDPSGKTKDRPLLDRSVIEANIEGLRGNISNFFNNSQHHHHKPLLPIKILDNREWYKDKNVIEFLTQVGRHFRMGKMLSRTSVQSRLSSAEGLCLTEFLYQVLQAYDWYHLHKNHRCCIQIGGGDQTGNIVSGFEFISKFSKTPVYGITTPLLTTPAGEKIGKSAGNAVWLDADKTSPFELYQHLSRTPDEEIKKYLLLFTLISEDQCFELVKNFKENPKNRLPHKTLAEEVLKMIHGKEGLTSAQVCTEALYNGSIEKLGILNRKQFQETFKGAPTTLKPLNPGTTVLETLLYARCFSSQRDAERIMKAGGVWVNHQKITNPSTVITPGTHILPNNFTIVRIGKKSYHIIDWQGTGFHELVKGFQEH